MVQRLSAFVSSPPSRTLINSIISPSLWPRIRRGPPALIISWPPLGATTGFMATTSQHPHPRRVLLFFLLTQSYTVYWSIKVKPTHDAKRLSRFFAVVRDANVTLGWLNFQIIPRAIRPPPKKMTLTFGGANEAWLMAHLLMPHHSKNRAPEFAKLLAVNSNQRSAQLKTRPYSFY